jgi:hypothetical protein
MQMKFSQSISHIRKLHGASGNRTMASSHVMVAAG